VFYFQQLLNTALAGIDGTAIISTVTNIAFAILLIGFLIGLYQAAFRGGDLQALAGTAIKYLVVAMIVSNWATCFAASMAPLTRSQIPSAAVPVQATCSRAGWDSSNSSSQTTLP